MTILVTGATGTIGRCVVNRLKGTRVRAMTRDPRSARLPSTVEVVHGDFTRPETWADALAGIEVVTLFPFATKEFIDAAARAGVRRFVVHSAAAAGFHPDNSTDALRQHLEDERQAHRRVELAVEATGAEWTHVRPGLLATNALAWAPRIRTERLVREPHGQAGYPVVHEADIADVIAAAALTDTHIGATYTLTGPAKVTQTDQVTAIATAIGQEIRFEELTGRQAQDQWRQDGCPEEYLDWRLALLEASLNGTGQLPPTDTYERITGRPPRTFTRWALDHAEDFR